MQQDKTEQNNEKRINVCIDGKVAIVLHADGRQLEQVNW